MKVQLSNEQDIEAVRLRLEPFYQNKLAPTCRVDPKIQTKKPQPITLRNLYRFIPFILKQKVASAISLVKKQGGIDHAAVEFVDLSGVVIPVYTKRSAFSKMNQVSIITWIDLRNSATIIDFSDRAATSIATTLFHHHVYGPPKKSWGLEMSLFTTFLRASAAYSHLTNMTTLRKFINVGSFLPTPKDGIVTPVSFKIRKRGLRGFLKEWDEREDGNRELTGEWVITRKLWKRMQVNFKDKHKEEGRKRENVILYFHGGAYFSMNAQTHRALAISLSRYTDSRLFVVNYRLAPESQFPAPLHDLVYSYFRLIDDLNILPEDIIFAGDSAGGGLALATMLYLKDEGYPLPKGAVLMSPWVDLTMSSDSWDRNAPWDYIPQVVQDNHFHPVKLYLGSNIENFLTHPYASPIYGDLTGLPPLLIQSGEVEVLRDEASLLAHKASFAGVNVIHELFEDGVHVFQVFLFLESSKKALRSMGDWVRYLRKRGGDVMTRSDDQDKGEAETTYKEFVQTARKIDKQGTRREGRVKPNSRLSSDNDHIFTATTTTDTEVVEPSEDNVPYDVAPAQSH